MYRLLSLSVLSRFVVYGNSFEARAQSLDREESIGRKYKGITRSSGIIVFRIVVSKSDPVSHFSVIFETLNLAQPDLIAGWLAGCPADKMLVNV